MCRDQVATLIEDTLANVNVIGVRPGINAYEFFRGCHDVSWFVLIVEKIEKR